MKESKNLIFFLCLWIGCGTSMSYEASKRSLSGSTRTINKKIKGRSSSEDLSKLSKEKTAEKFIEHFDRIKESFDIIEKELPPFIQDLNDGSNNELIDKLYKSLFEMHRSINKSEDDLYYRELENIKDYKTLECTKQDETWKIVVKGKDKNYEFIFDNTKGLFIEGNIIGFKSEIKLNGSRITNVKINPEFAIIELSNESQSIRVNIFAIHKLLNTSLIPEVFSASSSIVDKSFDGKNYSIIASPGVRNIEIKS